MNYAMQHRIPPVRIRLSLLRATSGLDNSLYFALQRLFARGLELGTIPRQHVRMTPSMGRAMLVLSAADRAVTQMGTWPWSFKVPPNCLASGFCLL